MRTEFKKSLFWSKVKILGSADCWEWMGYRDPNGYGRYGRILAHRIAYLLEKGIAKEGTVICHSCDNPACCNPSHLWEGSQQDNIADMDRKGRRRSVTRKGEDSNKSKLTAEQAMAIFNSNETGPILAARYGISKEAVYRIKRGSNWAHVTGVANAT